jgi:hypothetical protein
VQPSRLLRKLYSELPPLPDKLKFPLPKAVEMLHQPRAVLRILATIERKATAQFSRLIEARNESIDFPGT